MIVAAIVMAVIIYGSLYPFAFRVPAPGDGPLPALLATWANRPGRGDFISNILLYLPLGYFGVLAFSPRLSRWQRILPVLLVGAALSLAMELTQYYDADRDSTLTDFYSNTIGTALGAIAGSLLAGHGRWRFLRALSDHREPVLLLAGWLGYRLFPYVPVVDLHKYWDALKPVVLHPRLSAYDLCRHTATWLVVYALLAAVFRSLRPTILTLFLPFFVGAVIFAEILIIGRVLSVAELSGAALAFALWILLGVNARLRLTIITALFTVIIVAQRLEPFDFSAVPGHFGWIPFYSFMQGSIGIDVQSFFEKFFLYGALIWLLVELGWRIGFATISVALILLTTSWLEIYIPGRSAEITDAAMALAIASIAALSKRPASRPSPLA